MAAIDARFAAMWAKRKMQQIPSGTAPTQPELPNQPRGEGRRPQWGTSDVGYFWPDMPINIGSGRLVDHKNNRFFRDVNAFVSRIGDDIPYYGAETMHNNVQNCFKGQASSWNNDVMQKARKNGLRTDPSPACRMWCESLVDNFKMSGAQAMKKIMSASTCYTVTMINRGDSLTAWFVELVLLARDAGLTGENQKLMFVWNKMDAELQERLPKIDPLNTIESYLQALREAEESVREALREQDRRHVMQIQKHTGIGYQQRPRYPYNASGSNANRRTSGYGTHYQPRGCNYQENRQPRDYNYQENRQPRDYNFREDRQPREFNTQTSTGMAKRILRTTNLVPARTYLGKKMATRNQTDTRVG
jgi:hypothetical protein